MERFGVNQWKNQVYGGEGTWLMVHCPVKGNVPLDFNKHYLFICNTH